MERRKVKTVDSPEKKELLLSGLVVEHEGFLKVRNRIYELIFDRSWVEFHLAKRDLRLNPILKNHF